MTDLTSRYAHPAVANSELDWLHEFTPPRTLTETVWRRPEASASWALGEWFVFKSLRPDFPAFRGARATARRPWLKPLLSSLGELFALRPNWNGYGEFPIDRANALRVVEILNAAGFDGPAPSVVPLHDGGVQIEWHGGEHHIEIEVAVGEAPSAWWNDGADEDEWPLVTSGSFRRLHERLSALTAP